MMEKNSIEKKREKIENIKKTLELLSTLFPKCFFLTGHVKPLKIGIFKDLVAREEVTHVSKNLLRQALRRYTSAWKYLRAQKVGAHRIDLDGNLGDIIEESHANYALEILEKNKEKIEKNKKEYSNKKLSRTQSVEKLKKSNHTTSTPRSRTNTKTTQSLKKVELQSLKINQKVLVLIANKYVSAIIEDIKVNDIFVRLNFGAVVKVKAEYLKLSE